MKQRNRQQGKGAFDLIEEAVHLLRTAPAATLAVYYLGAIPFVLGMLFFWADMSRSPFAGQHLVEASLATAALFLWMKFCQVFFARRVRTQIVLEPLVPFGLNRSITIFFTQTILQPLGLFLIPLSALPVLPFGWVYAFFQNITALSDGEDSTYRLAAKSWKQGMLWPRQNVLILGIILAFGLYVFLNWTTVGLVLPGLFKLLFGVESAFSKSPQALLNSTFFAGMFGLSYLCVDPILKTIYVLRCFYGESLVSGEDLKTELKPFVAPARTIAATLLMLSAIVLSSPALAADPASTTRLPVESRVSTSQLDEAIHQTIQERKYVWRMPRDKTVESDAEEGLIAKFFDKIGAMIRKAARAVQHWLRELWHKLFPPRHPITVETDPSGYGWIVSVEILLYGLAAAVLAALALFLYRIWRDRGKSATTVAADAIPSLPDVADENIHAGQLPEDGWTRMARELLERGEFRLAMRAWYLASLSHLASRNLIHLARFKSNRDYERELRRRAHSFSDLLSLFDQNVSVFERIWYGQHGVDRELVNQFSLNVEKIKTAG